MPRTRQAYVGSWTEPPARTAANCAAVRSDDHEGAEHIADRGRTLRGGPSRADDGVETERSHAGREEALQAHLIPPRRHERLRPEVPWRQGARDLAGSEQSLARDELVIRLVLDQRDKSPGRWHSRGRLRGEFPFRARQGEVRRMERRQPTL